MEPPLESADVSLAPPKIVKTKRSAGVAKRGAIRDVVVDAPPPSCRGFTDPHVVKALRYAESVVEGKTPACRYVVQACQRQLRDLERFANHPLYYFDEARAARPCRFIECLPHIEGPKAFIREDGEPNTVELEGWQCFIVTTVFGWRRRDTGGRRFRRAYTEVPRGNGKSFLSSGIALYCMAEDGEEGAQVYSAATTRDQAKIVWGAGRKMLRRKPSFQNRLGIITHEHQIFQPRTNSVFLPLSREADNLDGLNIHCAVVDELHAHKTREVYDVIETGCQKRVASLMWVITTSGSDTSGICYEVRMHVLKILSGTVDDETQFGVVFTVDEGDDWQVLITWVKANPNWGVSVYPDSFAAVAMKAMHTPAAQSAFKTKHLDIWVNADQAWMDMRLYDLCADPRLHPDQLRGASLFGGLDVASVTDIAAGAKVFVKMQETKRRRCQTCHKFEDDHATQADLDEYLRQPRLDEHEERFLAAAPCIKFEPSSEIAFEPHYYAFLRSYLPEATIEESRNSQYKGWAEEGRIKEISGPVIDQDFIKHDLVEDHEQYHFKQFGYDEWQAEKLALELTRDPGIEMVKIPANTKNFSAPMKEWDKAVRTKRFHHDGDPVLRWMVSNCVCHTDANENIFPRKERAENKIDGVVAIVMALARAIVYREDTPEGYSDGGGFRSL